MSTPAWVPDDTSVYDWQEALSSAEIGTVGFPPQPVEALSMSDIARVDAYAVDANEGGTELELYAVLELVDGRWAALEAWNDYTGWGCQDGSSIRVGKDRDAVIRFGLTDEGRRALGLLDEAASPPPAFTDALGTAHVAEEGH